MKTGDLVSLKMKKTQPAQIPRHGVIVNTWKGHRGQLLNVDILWGAGNVSTHIPALFEVINESR